MDKILSGRQTDIFIVCNENYPLMSLSVGIFFGFYSILPAMNTAWWPVFQKLNAGRVERMLLVKIHVLYLHSVLCVSESRAPSDSIFLENKPFL